MGKNTQTLEISNLTWRKDLIARQFFCPPSDWTVADLVQALAYVQLDSIRVVERAHHCILASRLKAYRCQDYDQAAYEDRGLFENWTHDACALSVGLFPLAKLRFEREFKRQVTARWWIAAHADMDALCAEILATVEAANESLPMRYFTELKRDQPAGQSKPGEMWAWSPVKTAVEFLWRTGRLGVARRENFNKFYDLTERLFPSALLSQVFSEEEAIDQLCYLALARLGYATAKEITAFWDFLRLSEVRTWLQRTVEAGQVIPIKRETAKGAWQEAYVLAFSYEDRLCADWEALVEQQVNILGESAGLRLKILSPFDPLVRNRNRLADLFGFDYKFEAFVPAAKRRFGYYVFPVIEKWRFVGRLEMSLDKGTKSNKQPPTLVAKRFWPEPGIKMTQARRAALRKEMRLYARLSDAQICRRADFNLPL